jgi:hypothetical protein
MVLPRITNTTALPTVRGLAGDLNRFVTDVGVLSSARNIGENLARLQQECGNSALRIDIGCTGAVDDLIRENLARWVSQGISSETLFDAKNSGNCSSVVVDAGDRLLETKVFDLACPPIRRSGEPLAPVLVGVLPLTPMSDLLISKFEMMCEDRPLVIVLGKKDSEEHKKAIVQAKSSAWHAVFVDIDSLEPNGLGTLLSSPPWRDNLDVLKAQSLANALDSEVNVFEIALENELGAIKAKRALVQQRAAKIQTRPATSVAPDIIGEVRSRLQRQFTDFQRGAAARLQALLGSSTGSFGKDLEAQLNEIHDLERTHSATSTITSLSPENEDRLLRTLSNRFATHCLGDLVSMKDFYALVRKEVEQVVSAVNGPSMTLHFQYIDQSQIDRIVRDHFLLQRHYRGELPRKGFFEYFMAARRYLTVLTMLLSVFGLAFLRNKVGFMIPVSVALMTIGAVMVYRTVKRERVESSEKEIEKARELIRSESRRIASEAQRAWSGLLEQHLSDQQQLALAAIETTLKDFFGRQSEDVTGERQKIQRQLQGLEMTERRLSPIQKGKDTVANALAQLKGEFRQLLLTSIKPTAREQTV